VSVKYPPSGKELLKLLKNNAENLGKIIPNIKKIILFGSFARLKPHANSDVDLLFIIDKRFPNDFEIIYEFLYDLSLNYEWAPLILDVNHFKKLQEEKGFFIREILEEGIIIYSEL